MFDISVIFMFGWEVGNSCFCRGGLLRLSVRERENEGGGENYLGSQTGVRVKQ